MSDGRGGATIHGRGRGNMTIPPDGRRVPSGGIPVRSVGD
ncbi:hypothetical protein HMPREF3193_00079 [Bifidobacterium breve]|nr:hypothetical protein HMPREF1587_00922 [Bifidobacterium breve JCP7499]KWZ86821.1 hypothetical protein HMPREF3193_00079 [Bifidobacterium breve]